MASISSLSGSSSSSIYGTRNVLSGLASGMDTESMIENAVSGYQLKLTQLQQKKTKVEWKQEAYRSMITKLVGFSQKYTSYTSGTNLLSKSFFDNATKVTSLGKNASKISAVGRTNSDVKIKSVSKLATAAKYTVSAKSRFDADEKATTAKTAVSMNGNTTVGALDGVMTLSYGNKNVAISFSESDVFVETTDEKGNVKSAAQNMADAINKKLEDEVIAFDNGSQEKASERIKAVASADGKSISFEKVKEDGNTVKISRVSGNLSEKLGIGEIDDKKTLTDFTINSSDSNQITATKTYAEILSEKEFTITLNGKTKTIKGPKVEVDESGNSKMNANEYVTALQTTIEKEFGSKLQVENVGDAENLQLKFSVSENTDSFKVTVAQGEQLGMEGGLSNRLNLSRKLSDIISDEGLWGEGAVKKDGDGNVVKDSEGNEIREYEFKINESSSIKVTKDMTLQELMDKLNSDKDSTIKMNYSSFSDQLTFTTKDTGANQEIKFSGLSEALFGKSVETVKDENGNTVKDANGEDVVRNVTGSDAQFEVEVDGVSSPMTRSSNSIEIDGLTITLKGTFEKTDADYEPVTFSFSADADKVVDAVKEMVKDYNAMMTEIKEAYSTIPLKNSKGDEYMPLTDEDRADMSESAVANYEKKAKTGLLFADRDLSNLYSAMTEALRAFGISGNDGTGIGITTSYSNGTTTLVADENALRAALESNPDKVRDVFIGKNGNDGVMQKLKNQLDTYAGTTGATKGILINKAGSTLAPTSVYQNTLQKEIDGYEDEIESWQDKIADKIDYYNKKFTSLEKLIAQMNNQSSMLGGLMGGY